MNSNGFADKLECVVVFFGSLPSDSSFFVWGGVSCSINRFAHSAGPRYF